MDVSLGWVGVSGLSNEIHVLNLVLENMARDLNGFASDDYDLISDEDLVSNN